MTKPEIIGKLEQIFDMLDDLQETKYFQLSNEAINDIGEAMGYVENAIDDIKKGK